MDRCVTSRRPRPEPLWIESPDRLELRFSWLGSLCNLPGYLQLPTGLVADLVKGVVRMNRSQVRLSPLLGKTQHAKGRDDRGRPAAQQAGPLPPAERPVTVAR